MAGDAIAFLEEWYASHCDGEWEHDEGVRLTTLDNPGWLLTINLLGTDCEGRTLDTVETSRSEEDWLRVSSDGTRFRAVGGARSLRRALEAFRQFVEQDEDKATPP